MQEASHFSALISFYAFFIFAHIERNRSYSIIRLICFMALSSWVLLGLGSKGAIGGLVIAMMTIGFRWRQLPYLLLITPLVWILAATQFTALTLDYAEFSSVATRLGLALTTIMALAVNPLGYGYYGFYGAVQNFGTKAIDNLSQIFTLNLLELHSIVTDLVAVSTKSTLLDFLLTFGVFFIIFAWKLICRIDLMDPRARVFLLYIFIISMTASRHASIPFFLGLVGLNRYFPRKCINFKY